MTALAAAVMPIIMLLVAVATRNGTPIARFISGTLTIPPPIPSRADTRPGDRGARPRRRRGCGRGSPARTGARASTAGSAPDRGVVLGVRVRVGRVGRRVRGLARSRREPSSHATYSSSAAEQQRQQLLVEQERDRATDERADRGEQLERHPEPQVRDVAFEVDAGRRAAGHDDRDERDADGLAQRQTEAERQERDEEDPAAEPEERPEDTGGRAAAEHQQADDHLRRSTTAGGCGRRVERRRRLRAGGAAARTGAGRRGGRA